MTTEDPAIVLPRMLRELQALPPSPDREAAIAKVEGQIQLFGSEEPMAETPRLGTGNRFKKLVAQVAAKGAKADAPPARRSGARRFGRLAAKKQQSE